MIGISMALTIAVCVAGFSVIYSALDEFTGDFISRDAPTETPPAARADNDAVAAAPDTANQNAPQPTTAAEQPTPEPTSPPAPTATPSTFTADYQITSSSSVYLRSGPGTSYEPVVTLSPQTLLQFLNDRQATADPEADGFSGDWLKFRDEDGQEGWIREIDVGSYTP